VVLILLHGSSISSSLPIGFIYGYPWEMAAQPPLMTINIFLMAGN